VNLRRWSRNWLLWLALLLPVAQAMAGAHALSHVGERQDDGVAHLVHCDLCLTAAHLGAGAPAAQAAALPASPAGRAAAGAAVKVSPGAPRLGLPPARAPPASV
jgi:hypothetical protein